MKKYCHQGTKTPIKKLFLIKYLVSLGAFVSWWLKIKKSEQ